MIKNLSKEKVIKFGYKFVIGTVISYSLNLGIPFILTEFLKIWYFWSYLIARCIQIIFAYIYNGKILFQSNLSNYKFIKFTGVIIIMDLLNGFTVKFFTESLNIYYIYSIALSLSIYVPVRYTLYYFFVYKK